MFILIKSLSTQLNGFFLFCFVVQVVLATLWQTLSKAAAATALTDSDGVLNATTGLVATTVTTPLYGVVDMQFDFGFVSIVLGNRVWLDANANGLQNAGESGIAGVVVELVDGVTGLVVATKSTDASGLYTFTAVDGLRATSNVTVRIALNQMPLRGLVVAPPTRGIDVTIDSLRTRPSVCVFFFVCFVFVFLQY